MREEELNEKIGRYLDGSATQAERSEVDDWYDRMDEHPGLTGSMSARALGSGMHRGFAAVMEAIQPSVPEMAVNRAENKSANNA